MNAKDAHRPNLLRSVGVVFRGIFVLARRRVYPRWPTDHFELTLISRIMHALEWRYERHAKQRVIVRAQIRRIVSMMIGRKA